MKKKLSIAIVIAVLSFTGNLWAKDIYVRAGSEGNAGTIKEPYKDLWKAVDKALRGDVIHVSAGII